MSLEELNKKYDSEKIYGDTFLLIAIRAEMKRRLKID